MFTSALARRALTVLLLIPVINAAITLKLESHPRYDAGAVGQNPGLQGRSLQSHQLVRYSLYPESGSHATRFSESVTGNVRRSGPGRSRPKRQDTNPPDASSSVQLGSVTYKSETGQVSSSSTGTLISESTTGSDSLSVSRTSTTAGSQSLETGSTSTEWTDSSSETTSYSQELSTSSYDTSPIVQSSSFPGTSASGAESTGPVNFAGGSTTTGGSPTQTDPSTTTDDRVALPLNSKDSGGAAFTIQLEVGGRLMKVLVSRNTPRIEPQLTGFGRRILAQVNSGSPLKAVRTV